MSIDKRLLTFPSTLLPFYSQ